MTTGYNPEDASDDSISVTSTAVSIHDPDEFYEVDRILADKLEGRQMRYLVLWDGYPLHRATWEPRVNIQSESTIRDWKERKSRVEAGLSDDDFDIDEWERHNEELAAQKRDRCRRRKAKRMRLLKYELRGPDPKSPQESIRHESLEIDSSEEDEAWEDNDVEDDQGITPKTIQSKRARLKETPKQALVQEAFHPLDETRPSTNDRSSSDDSSDDEPLAVTRPPTKLGTESLHSEHVAGGAPSHSHGDQTSITEAPAFEIQPTHSPPIASSVESSHGGENRPPVRKSKSIDVATAPKSIFGPRPPVKKRGSLLEVSLKSKDVKHYTKRSLIRKAELQGREMADREPDLNALGGLFNPGAYSGLRPETFRRLPIQKDVNFEILDSETPLDETIASELFVANDEPGRLSVPQNIQSEEQYSAPPSQPDHTPLSGRPDFNPMQPHRAICWFYFHRQGECIKGSDCLYRHTDSILFPIAPNPREKLGFRTAISSQPQEPLKLRTAICRYWKAGTCSRSAEDCWFLHPDPGQQSAPISTHHSIPRSSDPISPAERFSDPPRHREELSGPKEPLKPGTRKKSVTFAIDDPIFDDGKNASEMDIDHPEVATGSIAHSLDFEQLLPHTAKPKGNPYPYKFFILCSGQSNQTAEFIKSWILSKEPLSVIFNSRTEGSWDSFIKSDNIGIILVLESGIVHLNRLPSLSRSLLQERLVKSPRNFVFWYISEGRIRLPLYPSYDYNFEENKDRISAVRLFPHGCAFLLTPTLIIAEPDFTLRLLNWFLFNPKSKFETLLTPWKIVACHNLIEYLLEIAIAKAKQSEFWQQRNAKEPALEFHLKQRGLGYNTTEIRLQLHVKLIEVLGFLGYDSVKALSSTTAPATDPAVPIVYAPEFIEPDDEEMLVEWFAGWSMQHADIFRKFVVVGTGENTDGKLLRILKPQPINKKYTGDHIHETVTTSPTSAVGLYNGIERAMQVAAKYARQSQTAGSDSKTQMEIESEKHVDKFGARMKIIHDRPLSCSSSKSVADGEDNQVEVTWKMHEFEPTTTWYNRRLKNSDAEPWEHIIIADPDLAAQALGMN